MIRASVSWALLKTFNFGIPALVGQQAEDLRNLDGVIQPELVHIGLPHEHYRSSLRGFKEAFERCQRDRLVLSHHSALSVSSRKYHEQGRCYPGNDAHANEDGALFGALLR